MSSKKPRPSSRTSQRPDRDSPFHRRGEGQLSDQGAVRSGRRRPQLGLRTTVSRAVEQGRMQLRTDASDRRCPSTLPRHLRSTAGPPRPEKEGGVLQPQPCGASHEERGIQRVHRRKKTRTTSETTPRHRHRVSSTATSPPIDPISCGSPTSPTCGPKSAGSMSPRCSTCSRAASSGGDGRSSPNGLVTDALNMALFLRRPQDGLVPHSDRGCQFTQLRFRAWLPRGQHHPLDGICRRCLRQTGWWTASSRRSSASCSIGSASGRNAARGRRSSTSSGLLQPAPDAFVS